MKRNHSDICIYNHNNETTELGNRRQGLEIPSSSAGESHASTSGVTPAIDPSGNATSFLGENSAASYLRQMGGAESPITKDIVPALGLRNTLAQYPFINAETEDEKSRELTNLLPTHQEILNFYHVYRAVAFPLASLIVDIGDFESYLSTYLEKLAGSNPTGLIVTNGREDAARIALLLATLAAGAQYSDRDPQERRKISRDFGIRSSEMTVERLLILLTAKRSFHALRLANFLLRPLLTSLQALLILGTFLQNDGMITYGHRSAY